MARQKKRSPIEDIILIAAKMPWYVEAIAAVVTFGILHSIATKLGTLPPSAMAPDLHNVGANLTTVLIGIVAYLFQFVIPAACLIGAAASAWNQRHRTKLVASVTGSQTVSTLDGMTWREFEQLVG